MGFLSSLTGSLRDLVKQTTTSDSIKRGLASGGLTTIHQLNKGEPIHHELGDKLFPDKPAVPDAPPAPTMSDAEAAGEDKANQLRRRRGLAATVLAGSMNQQPTTRAASLLGS